MRVSQSNTAPGRRKRALGPTVPATCGLIQLAIRPKAHPQYQEKHCYYWALTLQHKKAAVLLYTLLQFHTEYRDVTVERSKIPHTTTALFTVHIHLHHRPRSTPPHPPRPGPCRHHSSVITHQASLFGHPSSVITHQPSPITHHSSLIAHQSSLITHHCQPGISSAV